MQMTATKTKSALPEAIFEMTLSDQAPPKDKTERPEIILRNAAQTETNLVYHEQDVEIQNPTETRVQQEATSRAGPYKLALGTANRCNGLILDTIMEQASCSTLTCRHSILNAERHCFLRSEENTSPSYTVLEALRNEDKNTLQIASEDGPSRQRELGPVNAEGGSAVFRPCGREQTFDGDAMLINSIPTDSFQLPVRQFSNLFFDINTSRANDFHCSELSNLQANPRSSFQPCSTTFAENLEGVQAKGYMHHSHFANQLQTFGLNQTSILDPLTTVSNSGYKAMFRSTLETQCHDWNVPTRNFQSPAFTHTLCANVSPANPKPEVNLASAQPWLNDPITICAEEPSFSVPLVSSVSHHGMFIDNTSGQIMCSAESLNNPPANYRCNNANELPSKLVPIISNTCGRGSSRSISRCNSASTSYSGTVLGVDLDLYRNFTNPYCRLRQSASSISKQFPKIKSQLSFERSRLEFVDSKEASLIKSHHISITSSALTSLLPIARASGIVHPNYDTPTISFYSPSGNIIQPEGDWISPRRTSKNNESPSLTSLDCEKSSIIQNAETDIIYLPPARPWLIPSKYLPSLSAPMPAHLKPRQKYPKLERFQVTSCETIVENTTTVPGCDGIVRSKCLTPFNEFLPSYSRLDSSRKCEKHRWARSKFLVVKNKASEYGSQILATPTSFWALRWRIKKVRKPSVPSIDYASYSSTSSTGSTRTAITNNKPDTTDQTNDKQRGSFSGALAAHTLRVCFCQPYDGAGKQKLVVGPGFPCFREDVTIFVKDEEPIDDQMVRRVHFVSPETDTAQILKAHHSNAETRKRRQDSETYASTVITRQRAKETLAADWGILVETAEK